MIGPNGDQTGAQDWGLWQQALGGGAGFGGLQQGLDASLQTLGVAGRSQNITWNADSLNTIKPDLPSVPQSWEEGWLRGRVGEICQYGVQ